MFSISQRPQMYMAYNVDDCDCAGDGFRAFYSALLLEFYLCLHGPTTTSRDVRLEGKSLFSNSYADLDFLVVFFLQLIDNDVENIHSPFYLVILIMEILIAKACLIKH